MAVAIPAVLYALCTAIAVGFQLALAAGAPWGHLAMGGRYPGRLPTAIRMAAWGSAAMLIFLALVVLSRADQIDFVSGSVDWLAWVAVAVSAISLVMNLATPSAPERRLWAPIGAIMVLTSLAVALS